MAKLKITIHPLSLVILFLLVYFGWLDDVLFYIVALICHEYSHYYVAKKLGYSLNNLKFSPFGAVLNGTNIYFKKKDEVMIAFAGPFVNLALALICVALWWLWPESYIITYSFVLANMSLFICNMLPLFPLDAGRILLAIIKDNKKFAKIYKFYKINSIIASVILIFLFVGSAFDKINISLLLIAIFLIMSIFDFKNSLYYQYSYLDKNESDYSKILPIKEYYIPLDTDKYKILKLIDKNTYSVFNFVDKNGNIIKTLNEKDMMSALLQDNRGVGWKR